MSLVLLCGFAWTVAPLAAQDEPDPDPDPAELVRRLLEGDAEASTRAAAALADLGDAAQPALGAALDRERERILTILAVLAEIEGQTRNADIPPLWVRRALDRAGAAYEAGRVVQSRRIAEALAVLAPPGPWRDEAGDIAQRAIEEQAASVRFEVRWEPASHLVLQPGDEAPSPTLVLENAGEDAVEIQVGAARGRPAASSAFVHLAISAGTFDLFGNAHKRMATRALRAPGTIRLEPGESWRQTLELDLPAPASDEAVQLVVRGRFRPASWRAGDTVESGAIRVPPLQVAAVGVEVTIPDASSAAGLARALEEPSGGDEVAVSRRVFAQALALPPAEESIGVDRLVTALDTTDGPLRRAILSALPVLTGRPPEDDPDAWILWWMSGR